MAVGLAVALSGCATTTELPPSEARLIVASDAVIIPPPGGPAIVSVVSTTFTNAVRQDIFLATNARTAGENKMSVILFAGEGSDGDDSGLRDIPFTQVNLTEEALAAWPNSGMAVSPYFVQNAYGPFGYAIGKPPTGDTCIYAWQRIAPTLKPSGALDRGTVTIRLQLCQQGATEQQLVEVMYKLRLDASLFPPGRAPAAIGAIGVPIRPVGAGGFAEVIPTAPAPAPARAPRANPVRAVVTPAVVTTPAVVIPTPAAGAPIVPPPTATSSSGAASQAGPTVPRPPASPSVIVPAPPGASN
ncbi:cellulose biosynthesis protein BcsN [Devosia rhizoryzae]|uniref:Cellulose biosynthesis protein BcsN n=1 Tax=Devosia rhizoryzae TaxID=2774137 RepID=A0ABX7C313_9HYPH|nr:cellulose biosynthesis protein BcsN [Devosia rhizoryzae]QQR38630.1 cellulose biosynthesis protein BcsN [Devosia rhizoryzae]